MKNEEHLKLLTKNKNILTGNVGVANSKYVENTPLYKFLDLWVKGKI
jgi:hypothetical protein